MQIKKFKRLQPFVFQSLPMVYPNPSDSTRENVLDGDWREWIGISANGGALWRVMGPVCHHHDQRECFVFALSPGSLSN